MVRLFPISDLHGNFIDVDRNSKSSPFNMDIMKDVYSSVLHTGDDTVLLACGDLGERMQGVLWCERMLQVFPNLNICYCPGNHEFYGANMEVLLYDMHITDMTRDRLHILDGVYKTHTIIRDSMQRPICTVVGSTLWTDFNKGNEGIMNSAKRSMNDYNYIRGGNNSDKIKPTRILNLHYNMRKDMFRQFAKASRDIPLIAMSHHTPYAGVPQDRLHYCYHTDMTDDFNSCSHLPSYWFSGHTHVSKVHKEEFNSGVVNFISNQVGYPHQLSTGFSLNCLIEV
jgi:hypothetical protein